MRPIIICENCASEKPNYALGLCGACYKKSLKIINPEYAANCRRMTNVWFHRTKTDPAKKARKLELERIRRAKDSLPWRIVNWKRRGADVSGSVALFTREHRFCDLCGKAEHQQKIKLSVDHCHRTGAARGLLCTACNSRVGLIESGRTDKKFRGVVEYIEMGRKK